MLRQVRTMLANALRLRHEGANPDQSFQKDAIAGMNRYIGRTERFVCALENLARAAGVSEIELDALHRMHGRFDTSKILHAWVPASPEAAMDTIAKVLHSAWDPIGCGVPADEYSSYAPVVVSLLREAENREVAVASVAAYLSWVRTNQMGLSGNRESCRSDAAAAAACVDALGV